MSRKSESKTSLLTWISAEPSRAFVVFILLHMTVWTVLPTLLYANLPLDLVEALVYGPEWQLGYDKLPPLPWWLVEIVYRLVGHDFAYYLLAQIVTSLAFALIFVMARPLVGTLGALVSVLCLDGLHYFNFTAVKFNHDVIQLPLWALAGLTFHRALRGNRMLDWVLLGLAVGISLWAKYFVIALAIPMMLFVVFDREARQSLNSPGPYVAVAIAMLVMAPHVAWLLSNDFLPLAYAKHRAILPHGWYDHFWHPLQFAIGQVYFLIPSFLIAAPLFIPPRSTAEPRIATLADSYDKRILTWLALGPFITVLAIAAISGRGTIAMWGYPLWLFSAPWLLLSLPIALTFERVARIVIAWAIIFTCFALAFVVDYTVLERFDHRYRAVFFPGSDLAKEISERYRKMTGVPPKYIIASMWDGGNISHYSSNHPRLLIDGDPARAPWIDLGDLRRQGALVVWTWGDLNSVPGKLGKLAATAGVQSPFVLPYRQGNKIVTVGWAILSPLSPPPSALKTQP